MIVEVSEEFYRPTDVVNLLGDLSKAREKLGWDPTKTSFEELVKRMVLSDIKKVSVERPEEFIRINQVEFLEKGLEK